MSVARATVRELVLELRSGLEGRADRARAPAMQAYMKSSMPFWGVDSTARRELVKDALARHPLPNPESWRAAVADLWKRARRREERYVAIDLLLARRYTTFLGLDALPLLEEIVVSGAWWDYVDSVAAHAFGRLLERHPTPMRRLLLRWAKSDDPWKRRTAILAQLRFKDRTDAELLYACIEPSLDQADFFSRKAIGWALRQYAWARPEEVRRKVDELGGRLSPLSRREALKNLTRSRRGSPRARARSPKARA